MPRRHAVPRIQPVEQLGEVGASTAPVERHRGLLVAALEGEQAALDLAEVTGAAMAVKPRFAIRRVSADCTGSSNKRR